MRRIVAALGLGALLVASAPSSATAGPLNEIQTVGFKFLPPVAVAQPGEEIVWTNVEPGPIPHNVVQLAYIPPEGEPVVETKSICPIFEPGKHCKRNGKADSKPLAPGTYLYTCTVNALHTANMQGVLVVQ